MFNIYSKTGLLRGYSFFDSEEKAEACYNDHNQRGNVPTKRPFHDTDRVHLGAS
jgi:hypothetical protein